MACSIYKALDGSERRIPSGVAHIIAPGEIFIGVDRDCAMNPSDKRKKATVEVLKQRETYQSLAREVDKEIGSGVGDWIKRLASPVAKLLGKSGCSSCETRRIVTNAYGQLKNKHGQLEALRIIKELWSDSFKNDDLTTVKKLKGYLSGS